MIGWGRLRAWTALIRPFYDRLDITVPFIFYSVPDTNPDGPATVFTDRFWDDRDHFYPDGVGVVPGSQKPYFGPVPAPTVGPLIGDPSWWVNGLSYAAFLAGAYGTSPCWPINPAPGAVRLRQEQRVETIYPPTIRALQRQAVNLGSGITLGQKQSVIADGVFGCVNCPGGAPRTYDMTVAGFGGLCVPANGSFALVNQAGSCSWLSGPANPRWALTVGAGFSQVFWTDALGMVRATYIGGAWDCEASSQVVPLNVAICPGAPLSVTLTAAG